ncbi:MAG: tetratricopeptide repeat protein [Gammaproteobacteria bacterium]
MSKAVREQLSRILSSAMFAQSDRQSRFLKYIVEETLAGRGNRLNGYLVGIEVFDRDESFDPAVDSIVRVEAGRLRSKLLEFYSDPGRDDPVVIDLPKGGYVVQIQDKSGDNKSIRSNDYIVTPDHAADVKPTIAVLPFDNLSADPDQEYFSDGITEDIITDLSKVSGLFVISRHSTFTYKGKKFKAREIIDDLGARYIVEGSVRKAGDHLRISAQLIDALTDNYLWADRFDRKLDDIFEIQDEVSRKIVNALQVKLTGQEDKRLGYKGTSSIEAHDFFLRGLEQLNLHTPEAIEKGIGLLSSAIEVDPDYAEAYTLKSRGYLVQFIFGFNNKRDETVKPAIELARKAIELDKLLPRAYASLGWALVWDGEEEKAIIEVRKSVELDPNYADGYMWLSHVQASLGEGETALELIEKATRINPHYDVIHLLAYARAYFVMGQYEEALAYIKRGIERNSNFPPNHVLKTSILSLLGREEEAESAKQELLTVIPDFTVSKPNTDNKKRRYLSLKLQEGLLKAGFKQKI